MLHRRRTALCCAIFALAVPGTALAAPIAPSACPKASPAGALCGTLTVARDHTGATPGTETLSLLRLPATGQRTGTIVVLPGGPGEPSLPIAGAVSKLMKAERATYDLVFVDARGTGLSGPTGCKKLDSAKDVTACANALGQRRQFLTSREDAYDLEEVRDGLGVPALTLYAVSAGGKVAGEYARRFPTHLASLVLDSPAPVDGFDSASELPQLGLARVLREVCWPPGCAAFLANPKRALSVLVGRMLKKPLSAPIIDQHGKAHTGKLDVAGLYELLSVSDLDPGLRVELPAALGEAVLGDPAPLLRLAALESAAPAATQSTGDVGRLLSTECIEGRLPWAPESDPASRTAAIKQFAAANAPAFAPFPAAAVLSGSGVDLCAAWPATPRPDGVGDAGPDVRTLVISGRDDLRTPLEDARRTAAQYPNSTLLAVPDSGHSVLTSDLEGCAVAKVADFLSGKAVTACKRVDRQPLGPAPFIPETTADLKPAAGVSTLKAARTLTAFAATLTELERQAVLFSPSLLTKNRVVIPGLRGGVATLSTHGIVMKGFTWIRGVSLSGEFSEHTTTVTVTGASAAAGTLRSSPSGTWTGTLGGAPIRFKQPLAAAKAAMATAAR